MAPGAAEREYLAAPATARPPQSLVPRPRVQRFLDDVPGYPASLVVAVSNFAFLPRYPLWSLLVIALDVFVIWALGSLVVDT